jgi:hypothetical protein
MQSASEDEEAGNSSGASARLRRFVSVQGMEVSSAFVNGLADHSKLKRISCK